MLGASGSKWVREVAQPALRDNPAHLGTHPANEFFSRQSCTSSHTPSKLNACLESLRPTH